MVILVDEEDRENEGDLVMAAEHVTPEAINFMVKHARGLVCLTLTDARCRQLGLKQMVSDNQTPHGTAFTVSIEAARRCHHRHFGRRPGHHHPGRRGQCANRTDIIQPGHIFPLRAQPGGVLVRAGHTEAGCDLVGMAGLVPASVICEILKEDGTMARLPDLLEFSQGTRPEDRRHCRPDPLPRGQRTPGGTRGRARHHDPLRPFKLVVFRDKISRATHLALTCGDDPRRQRNPGARA
jgi:3,4-dihydroxy 2-butanone 4-phosphate synthase/GTP cyclohydrolase II